MNTSTNRLRRSLGLFLFYLFVESVFLGGLFWTARRQTRAIEDRLEYIADLRDPSPFRVALLGQLEKVYLSVVSHCRHPDPSLLEQIAQGQSEFEKSLPLFQKQTPRLLPQAVASEILKQYQLFKTSLDATLHVSQERSVNLATWNQNTEHMLELIEWKMLPLTRKDRTTGSVRQDALLNVENQLRTWQQAIQMTGEAQTSPGTNIQETQRRGALFLDNYEQMTRLSVERKNLHELRNLWSQNVTLGSKCTALNALQAEALKRLSTNRDQLFEVLLRRLPAIPADELMRRKSEAMMTIRYRMTGLALLGLAGLISILTFVIGGNRFRKSQQVGPLKSTPSIPKTPMLVMDLAGKISVWSDAAERLYGYKSSEICGQPLTKLFSSESEIQRMSQELSLKKATYFDTIHLTQKGLAMPIRMEFLSPTDKLPSSKGVGLYCHTR